jgi:hypothetical protein
LKFPHRSRLREVNDEQATLRRPGNIFRLARRQKPIVIIPKKGKLVLQDIPS